MNFMEWLFGPPGRAPVSGPARGTINADIEMADASKYNMFDKDGRLDATQGIKAKREEEQSEGNTIQDTEAEVSKADDVTGPNRRRKKGGAGQHAYEGTSRPSSLETKAKVEADAQVEEDAKAKADAEAKAAAEGKAKAEADAQVEEDAKIKAEEEAKARSDAEAKATEEARAKGESDAQA